MIAARAILKLRPGAEFSINGSDIVWQKDANGVSLPTNVEWHTQTAPITKEEYEAVLPEIMETEPKQYQHDRLMEYPPLTELADALYWQSQGDETKMQQYLAKVKLVKDKYPK